MKILYAVQATGNGHISRAHQLYSYIEQYGDVDVFLSGSNSSLECDFPVKYKSDGFSLFFRPCGNLDYYKTFKSFKYKSLYQQARELPVEKYDLIINDFEYITAKACKIKNVPSVHFGHQASFLSKHTPRPNQKSIIAEWIISNYAKSITNVGLHFEKYDDFIFPPIIKEEFLQAKPEDHGHITIYLPAYKRYCIEKTLHEIFPQKVHWFLTEIQQPMVNKNIHYFPVNQKYFNESLIYCKGLITGGGFETPSEALYLNKKLMCIPISGHYEQLCNSAALKKLGIKILNNCDEKFSNHIKNWLETDQKNTKIEANDINLTLEYIIEKNSIYKTRNY